ncbi:MAG: hypothetical protein FI707_14270, partial [SAR202 cluster bacterium]|nr:hypothetical protein [SAR202 cluster bacterium]
LAIIQFTRAVAQHIVRFAPSLSAWVSANPRSALHLLGITGLVAIALHPGSVGMAVAALRNLWVWRPSSLGQVGAAPWVEAFVFAATAAVSAGLGWLIRRMTPTQGRFVPHGGVGGGAALALTVLGGLWLLGGGPEVRFLMTTGAIVFALGMADDVAPFRPSTKIFAAVVIATGFLLVDYRLGWTSSPTVNSMLTIVWIVSLLGAFSLLDRVGSLCGWVAVIAGSAWLWSAWSAQPPATEWTRVLGVVTGATVGVLVSSRSARRALGSSGCWLLGLGLAGLPLVSNTEALRAVSLLPVLAAPLVILLLPVFDQARLTVARLLTHRAPATLELVPARRFVVGLPERATVLILAGLATLGAAIGYVAESVTVQAVEAGLLGLLALVFALVWVRPGTLGDLSSPRTLTPLDVALADVRRQLAVTLDIGLVAATFYVAYRWQYGAEFNEAFDAFFRSLPLVLALQMTALFAVGAYRNVWRTFGGGDVLALVAAVVIGTLAARALVTALFGVAPGAAPIWKLDAGLLFAVVFASRAALAIIQFTRAVAQHAVVFASRAALAIIQFTRAVAQHAVVFASRAALAIIQFTRAVAQHIVRFAATAAQQLARNLLAWGTANPRTVLVMLAPASVTVLILQSFLTANHVPIVLKLTVGLVGAVAFVRPVSGLLIIAGLVPLGHVLTTRIWPEAYPANATEALVLAFLAGWLLHGLRRGDSAPRLDNRLRMPALLFGAVVVASLVVQVAVLQVWKDYPWPFILQIVTHLTRDYFTAVIADARPWAGDLSGFGVIHNSLLMLEGLALFLCVTAAVREDQTLARRLIRMIVAGAVGAATLSIVQLGMAMMASADPVGELRPLLSQGHLMHLSKLNSAGAYFLLTGLVALCSAAGRRVWRAGWLSAAGLILVALLLTHARAATAAGLGMVALIGMTAVTRRGFSGSRRASLVVMLVTGLVLSTGLYGYVIQSSTALDSLRFRFLMNDTSLRMAATHPFFGIGIDQYLLSSERFASPELSAILQTTFFAPRANAHNQFAQVAVELGLIGLTAFLWVIGSAFWNGWKYHRANRADWRIAGVLAGLAAFLLAGLVGHPLLFAEVAHPFWMLVGLAAGVTGLKDDEVRNVSDERRVALAPLGQLWAGLAAPARRPLGFTVLVILCVFASVPMRIGQEFDAIDRSPISYGFYNWERDGASTPFRWTGRRVRFFVTSKPRAIEIPMQVYRIGVDFPGTVEIALDGRVVNEISFDDDRWRRIRIPTPSNPDKKFSRVDLEVDRTWRPADVLPDSTDTRDLGIMIGEIVEVSDQ